MASADAAESVTTTTAADDSYRFVMTSTAVPQSAVTSEASEWEVASGHDPLGADSRVGEVGDSAEIARRGRSVFGPEGTPDFVYAAKPNVPEYMERGGEKYRIITDHLGSLRLVVNASTGEIKQRMLHDEHGNVVEDFVAPGWEPLPFGYGGGLYDRDTGLVRFGARDYDPEVGRWVQTDPLGFSGGDGNLYAYMGGDPVNGSDPRGLDTFSQECTCGATLFGVGGSIGFAIMQDDADNYGIGPAWNGGGSVLLSGGCTCGYQFTNADTIFDAAGCSAAGGGGWSFPKVAVNAEGIAGVQRNGRSYTGAGIYAGPAVKVPKVLGVPGPNYEMHGMVSCTKIVASRNVQADARRINVEGRLRSFNEQMEPVRQKLFRFFGRDDY
jgi:RHS repeat-associated protein